MPAKPRKRRALGDNPNRDLSERARERIKRVFNRLVSGSVRRELPEIPPDTMLEELHREFNQFGEAPTGGEEEMATLGNIWRSRREEGKSFTPAQIAEIRKLHKKYVKKT